MPYRSNSAAIAAKLQRAMDAGLQAAGQVVINAVKEGYNPPQYFTGWAHAHGMLTGTLLNSPTMTEPYDVPGGRALKVGTDYQVAAYWELGFWQRQWVWYDEKTGSFKSRADGPVAWTRHEVWRPAFEATLDQQRAAFERVFGRVMAA